MQVLKLLVSAAFSSLKPWLGGGSFATMTSNLEEKLYVEWAAELEQEHHERQHYLEAFIRVQTGCL